MYSRVVERSRSITIQKSLEALYNRSIKEVIGIPINLSSNLVFQLLEIPSYR